MAAAVGKFAANTLLKKQMKQHKDKKVEGGDDPYFAMVENPKKPGKYKKVKKTIPAYIPEHDAEILASVRNRAYKLDMCLFNFLGIRFGWEAVIGIVPMAGDAIGVAMALMVFKKCNQIEGGLESSIKMRMMINILLDFVVGLVPFIGDLADAAFKCNTRNLRLLETVLDKKYKPSRSRRDDRDYAGRDGEQRRKNRQSGIYMPNDPPPATAFEEFSDDELRDDDAGMQRPPPAYGSQRRGENVEMSQSRQETGRVRR